MVENLITDNNVIYIWKVVGSAVNGSAVYKIGTTSRRLGLKRIKECAALFGYEYQIVLKSLVGFRATLIERLLLTTFARPANVPKLNGYREFRRLSDEELERAKRLTNDLAFVSLP
jgi:hypothetical protein